MSTEEQPRRPHPSKETVSAVAVVSAFAGDFVDEFKPYYAGTRAHQFMEKLEWIDPTSKVIGNIAERGQKAAISAFGPHADVDAATSAFVTDLTPDFAKSLAPALALSSVVPTISGMLMESDKVSSDELKRIAQRRIDSVGRCTAILGSMIAAGIGAAILTSMSIGVSLSSPPVAVGAGSALLLAGGVATAYLAAKEVRMTREDIHKRYGHAEDDLQGLEFRERLEIFTQRQGVAIRRAVSNLLINSASTLKTIAGYLLDPERFHATHGEFASAHKVSQAFSAKRERENRTTTGMIALGAAGFITYSSLAVAGTAYDKFSLASFVTLAAKFQFAAAIAATPVIGAVMGAVGITAAAAIVLGTMNRRRMAMEATRPEIDAVLQKHIGSDLGLVAKALSESLASTYRLTYKFTVNPLRILGRAVSDDAMRLADRAGITQGIAGIVTTPLAVDDWRDKRKNKLVNTTP